MQWLDQQIQVPRELVVLSLAQHVAPTAETLRILADGRS